MGKISIRKMRRSKWRDCFYYIASETDCQDEKTFDKSAKMF